MYGTTTSPDPLRSRSRRRLGMLIGAVAAAGLAAVTAIAPGSAKAATQICGVQNGTNGGMYYQMGNNGQGSACITLNSASSYSTTWSGIGDFVAGVGWNPGSTSRTVSFSGSMSASGGTALLSLYGWSTSRLVEYYVIEDDLGGS